MTNINHKDDQNQPEEMQEHEWNPDGPERARQEVAGAIHHLLVSSRRPALLLRSEWTPLHEFHVFRNLSIYQVAARNAGCALITTQVAESGGSRYYLFLSTDALLSPAECIRCLPS